MMRAISFLVGLAIPITFGVIAYAGGAQTSGVGVADMITSSSAPEVCFRPEGPSCEALVVHAIAGAAKTLDVSWYNDTDGAIGQATVDAIKRGVKVRQIVDKISATQKGEQVDVVAEAGAEVRVDCRVAIHHAKTVVVDGVTVGLGSFNASNNAEKRNDEVWVVFADGTLAQQFEGHFETGWARSSLYHEGFRCSH